MSRTLTVIIVGTLCVSCIVAQKSCGKQCTVNTDCNPDTICNLCMGGQCGAGCGGDCVTSANCRDKNCRSCTDGVCQNTPNHVCAQPCEYNTDCSQDGSNLCQICAQTSTGGKCSVGCGQQCQNSTQCLNSTCTHCVLNQCAADNVPCGGLCKTDLDCDQSTTCSMCVAGKCGAGCSQACSANTDCLDNNCQYCTQSPDGSKVCSHTQNGKSCGQRCKVNTDCTGSPGTCQFCVGFKCGSPCGTPCKLSTDCVTGHCQNCNSTGFCGPS